MLSNAKDMLDLLRNNIGEAVPSLWEDINLMRNLNQAYMELYRKVSMASGQWLIKSTTLSFSESKADLPSDCLKPVYIEDANGRPITWLNSVGQRRASRGYGEGTGLLGVREAYLTRKELVINESNFSGQVTLWYQQKPVYLIAGTAESSDVGSLTLEDGLRHESVDDAYEGQVIELVSGSYPGLYDITAYNAATRTLTLDTTDNPGSVDYGLVPVTPEICNDFIVLRATVLAMSKPSANVDDKVYGMFIKDYGTVRREVEQWLATRAIENIGVSIGEVTL